MNVTRRTFPLHRPEEALDGVGDSVPMYHHHHQQQQQQHHLHHHHHMIQNGALPSPSLESPQSALSLVTEPLLDLRNFRDDIYILYL